MLAYERNVYHSMDIVFAMSEYLRQSFIDDFRVPEFQGGEYRRGRQLATFPDKLPAKDYTTKEVLFVGVQFARKGGPDLLRAFQAVVARHPESRLHIVGPRHIDIPASLQDHVVSHGFLSKHDPLGKAKLEDLYRRSCLFVMPSEV